MSAAHAALALVLALSAAGTVARAQQQQETVGQAVLAANCASDFSAVSRGSQIEGSAPYRYWRTGSPKATAQATLTDELAAGAVVESISFAYQYLAGFGPGGAGANFSLQVAGTVVYRSPILDAFNYSVPVNHTGYSPPIPVTTKGEPITVPTGGGQVTLLVENNDRNLQILLPLTFNVTCKSPGPCAKDSAWRPAAPTVVFRGGDKGPAGTDDTNTTGACFRIPQLARAPDGELLAFAEGRYRSCWPDVSPETRVVMRRSIDGGIGQKWAPIQVLWGTTAEQRGAGLNYPMPLVDYKTGEVSVFFYEAGCKVPPAKRGQKCVEPWPTWRVSSTDSGKTFSKPFNMSTVPGWSGITGGGKGIQLDNGRLVVACGNSSCYSDTHGKSWRRGAAAPLGPGVGGFGEEAVVADGRTPTSLALFIRSGSNGANGGKKSPLINHAVASSTDAGETYAHHTHSVPRRVHRCFSKYC
eukprot:COSAG02_NODE_5103_length_4628_cov_3.366085_1_plen_470_part_00